MLTRFHVSRGSVMVLKVVHISWGIGHILQGIFGLILHTWTTFTHATLEIPKHPPFSSLLEMFLKWFEGRPTLVGFMTAMRVIFVMTWLGEEYSLPCGEYLLDLHACSHLGDTFWAFLEDILRRSSTFEVLFHCFMRSFHLEERDVGSLLAWDDSSPCFKAFTSLFPWIVGLEDKIVPFLCKMSLSHESFLYIWHHLIMYWLSLLLCVDEKYYFLVT